MNDSKTRNTFWPRQLVYPTPEIYREFARDAGQRIAAVSLEQILAIPAGAIVHDNGCGTGAATAAIMAAMPPEVTASIKIIGTDITETEVEVYRTRSTTSSWPAEGVVMDADALSFPDGTFTHSIANLVVFVGPRNNGINAVMEMRRTLKPGGMLVVNCFAYTPSLEAVRQASRLTRPGGAQPEWNSFEDWSDPAVLAGIVEAGGFAKAALDVQQREVLIDVGDFNRHTTLTWSFRGMPSIGWCREDEERWDEAVEIVRREMRNTEGFRMLDDGSAVVRVVINVVTATK